MQHINLDNTSEVKCLLSISNELLDLSVMLERAQAITRNLVADYFGDRKEVHEKNGGHNLVYHYDDARIFTGIANDYVFEALHFVYELMDKIDKIDIEVAKHREEERGRHN